MRDPESRKKQVRWCLGIDTVGFPVAYKYTGINMCVYPHTKEHMYTCIHIHTYYTNRYKNNINFRPFLGSDASESAFDDR